MQTNQEKTKTKKKDTKLNNNLLGMHVYVSLKTIIVFSQVHRSLVRSISSSSRRSHIIPAILSARATRSTKRGIPLVAREDSRV